MVAKRLKHLLWSTCVGAVVDDLTISEQVELISPYFTELSATQVIFTQILWPISQQHIYEHTHYDFLARGNYFNYKAFKRTLEASTALRFAADYVILPLKQIILTIFRCRAESSLHKNANPQN